MESDLRKTGIDCIGDVPWGTHLCQFYHGKEDLIEILVPYFKHGLENNEFCLWVTSQPLEAVDARQALKEQVSDLDRYIDKGQIMILDHGQYYTKNGKFDLEFLRRSREEIERRAAEGGYCGLRGSGNTFWLEKEDWGSFLEYEDVLDREIVTGRLIAICSYSLEKIQVEELIDVISRHRFSCIKKKHGKWASLESSERQRIEGELHRSKDLLQGVIDAAPAAIVAMGLDGCVHTVWNKAAEKMFGWTAEEVMGQPLPMVPSENQKEFLRFLEMIRNGAVLQGVEVRRKKKDGSPIDYSIHAAPLHNAAGDIIGNIAVLVDITERKRAEDKLRESEEKFRSIVDNIGIGVALISPEMKILFLNNQMKKWNPHYDPNRETLCFRVFNTPPKDQVCVYCPTVKTLKDGVVHEDITRTPVGEQVFNYRIISSPIKDKSGKVIAAIEMVEDITERMRTQELLKKSENKFRVLFESSRDAIMTLEPPLWKFTSGNPASVQMFKAKDEAEFISFGPGDLSPAQQPDGRLSEEKVREMIEKAMREGSNLFEWRHKRLDGEEFAASVLLTRMILDDKTILQATLRDITDYENAMERLSRALKDEIKSRELITRMLADNNRVRTELENSLKKLKEAQAQLIQAEKLNAVGQLASGVAHEVRNPLGIILQGINYLDQKIPAKEKEVSETLVMLRDSVNRANRIINALLDFSKFSALDLRLEDVNTILENSLVLIKDQLKIGNIEVVKELKTDLPKVLVDKNKIEQVCLNVLLNAAQAMPEGGRIIVRSYDKQLGKTGNGSGKKKEEYAGAAGRAVIVEFEDTGFGISESDIKRIFDPFFSTKGPQGGTGLGLSVSMNIVNMHQGAIYAESKVNKGTRITMVLKTATEI